MNASFGIDHPLLATNDIEGLRALLIDIGFNMTQIGKHPWGTSTSLAMFDGCLLEIMGIYDESLIDEVPAGEFRFGRHVFEHLVQREGVALTALHSTDSQNDAKTAKAAGLAVAGQLEFGRDVTLPSGLQDRTKTTLALLPDKRWPRLSFFLCQQHRPELIYVPQWLEHPNSVCGIAGVTVAADENLQEPLRRQLTQLYGTAQELSGGFEIRTANGTFQVKTKAVIESEIAPLPDVVLADAEPAIVGMDFLYADESTLCEHLNVVDGVVTQSENVYLLAAPEKTANTLLRFKPI